MKVCAVNCVVGCDCVFVELADSVMFELYAEHFKGFCLCAYPGE